MPRLARPVVSGAPSNRVSKAAASACPWPAPLSQSRRPGPPASGSRLSSLPSLAAACAAIRRDPALDRPCMWVGPPTTRRSAPATSSLVAAATKTRVTSCVARRPSATLLATARVFPYIDSYTTSARMLITSLVRLLPGHLLRRRPARTDSPGRPGPRSPRNVGDGAGKIGTGELEPPFVRSNRDFSTVRSPKRWSGGLSALARGRQGVPRSVHATGYEEVSHASPSWR